MDDKIIQSFERLLVESDRVNEVFSQNIICFKEDSKEALKILPRLTLEIEQLKKTRESLSSFLTDQMQQAYLKKSEVFSDRFSSVFLDKVEGGLQKQQERYESSLKDVQKTFHQQIHKEKNEITQDLETHHAQAQEITQKYRQEAGNFKQEMDKSVGSMTRLMSLQKQRLTYRGLLICGIFCLTSVLTGAALFYFFPQHVYHPDQNTAKYLAIGKIVRDNYAKLSVEDKRLILDAMKQYVEKK